MDEELLGLWNQASPEERKQYLVSASKVLANLIHYKTGGNHEADDLRLVAATLLWTAEQEALS
jgi:hypothetical protein